ncbi:MAG: hypothetical protein M1416_02320 [Candidatus Pacearchaeota archaeon]|nr:hypothetical protein [Candidatus Pacearchaeota archaeon]
MTKTILNLIEEYNSGLDGTGPILWHKKQHKNGSGKLACLNGIICNCEKPVDCDKCYNDKNGGYCLEKGGESVRGFLAVEYKHEKLVKENAFGAYISVAEAIEDLSKNLK